MPIMERMRCSAVAAFLVATPLLLSAQATKPLPAPPDVAKPPADAARTKSGLASKVIKAGAGKMHPKGDDLVTVQYTGWTTDGKMFDSTLTDGKPATFPLNHVIAGWTEGVQLMVTGETRRFWIPEALAYKGQRDPKGMLVFDVELVSFTDSPEKPPADVSGPPDDSRRTASGLSYKVLTPGTGVQRPLPSSTVKVHFTGWTTDGKLFDSSILRGEPVTVRIGSVPEEGLSEGLQLMVEGEKMRLWIPENLAFKGQRDPKGMLVFDVELIKIQ
jgi:FKBP-type peptidyl-prolyl cis-trans isomerase